MKLKAYAKVNLVLKVAPLVATQTKHQIKSLVAIYKHIYDEIFITSNVKNQVQYLVNDKKIKICNDIVQKAISYLQTKFKIKQCYNIEIIKHIPIQSGLGGSATDGARVIRYILKQQNISLNRLNMRDVALNLGSDVPFFLYAHDAAIIDNYGDKVSLCKISLPKFKVILTNVKCNTKTIYRQ
jgi:4-diphosphocytidyl-2-C-methyl-D-erythritol kinase